MTTVKETYKMICPQCARDDALNVMADVCFRLHPTHEPVPWEDLDYDNESFAGCSHCGWEGNVENAKQAAAPIPAERIELRMALDHAAVALSLFDVQVSKLTDDHLKNLATKALLDKFVKFSAKHGINVVIDSTAD